MARRRTKHKTHVRNTAQNGVGAGAKANGERTPKSMVIRIGAGEVGPSITQLVKDVRRVMEPETAVRLKERKSNKLRDYTTMAGPLGVSHLMLFSRSEAGNVNMRLAITPRGPTLNFRVERYSLCKDIQKSQKHPQTGDHNFHTAPLLVMNNFSTPADPTTGEPVVPKHLETLTTTVFQSLFPAINPQATPLNSIKRVLLCNREPPKSSENGTYTINLRHYAITTRQTGVPKSIKRLNAAEKAPTSKEKKKGLPNLGKMTDIADYMLDPGSYTSASESEVDTDAEIEVLADSTKKVLSRQGREKLRTQRRELGPEGFLSRKRTNVEKRAVKLQELGPRMRLRLTKVEEGLCEGKVLWHEFITKTKEEVKKLDAKWEIRKQEKAERRRIQKENVERKRKEREARGETAEDGDEDEDMEDDFDDDEWDDVADEGVVANGGATQHDEDPEPMDEDMEDDEEG